MFENKFRVVEMNTAGYTTHRRTDEIRQSLALHPSSAGCNIAESVPISANGGARPGNARIDDVLLL